MSIQQEGLHTIAIVEDERVIRTSLKQDIDWRGCGCTIQGVFESGEDFLQWHQEQSKTSDQVTPEIVITDIRMKEVDGLMLASYLKQHAPKTKVVIITGYGDIKTAQAAIKADVCDYILKPIDPVELTDAVGKAVRMLDEDRSRESAMLELRERVQSDLPVLRQQYITQLTLHSSQALLASDPVKESFLGLDFTQTVVFCTALSEIKNAVGTQSLYENLMALQDGFTALGDLGTRVYTVPRSDDEIIALCLGMEVEQVESYVDRLASYLDQHWHVQLDIGISNRGSSSAEIGLLVSQAREALAHRFYIGSGSCIRYRELKKKRRPVFLELDRTVLDDILGSVSVGDSRQAGSGLEALWRKISPVASEDQLKSLALTMVHELSRMAHSHDLELVAIADLQMVYKTIQTLPSAQAVESYLAQITEQVSNLIQEGYKSSTKQVGLAAVEYIREHFSEPITLAQVASQALVSEKYLCKVLKMETGKTFKELQNDYRIEEALRLMRDSTLKTFEIAEEVGFSDARHFGQLFKKSIGKTPREFRSG